MTETARDCERIYKSLVDIRGLLRAYQTDATGAWLFRYFWGDLPAYIQRRLTEISIKHVADMAGPDSAAAEAAAKDAASDAAIAQLDRAIESYEKRLRAPPPPTEGEPDNEQPL